MKFIWLIWPMMSHGRKSPGGIQSEKSPLCSSRFISVREAKGSNPRDSHLGAWKASRALLRNPGRSTEVTASHLSGWLGPIKCLVYPCIPFYHTSSLHVTCFFQFVHIFPRFPKPSFALGRNQLATGTWNWPWNGCLRIWCISTSQLPLEVDRWAGTVRASREGQGVQVQHVGRFLLPRKTVPFRLVYWDSCWFTETLMLVIC